MTGIVAQSERLKSRVEVALGDLVDLVTLDGSGVKPQTRAAVVIQPPDLAFPNWQERDTTFRLVVVAGPADRPLRAVDQIDQILTALEAAQLPLKTASPASFKLAGSGYLPAYEVTLHAL